MTGVLIVADLRRRLASHESIAPVSPHPSGASRGEKRARLAGLAFRIYGFLSARRQKLLPLSTRASDFVDRLLITGRFGAALLRFTLRQFDRRSAFAAAAARLLLIALAATAQIHLAASHKPNAMRSIRLLNLIFRCQVRARRGLAASAYFSTLALCGGYERIMREIPQAEAIDSFTVNFAAGLAHMYRHSYPAALHFLTAAAASGNSNALRRLGCVYLLMGNCPKAAECFQASVDRDPRSVMAHQNYAAGYDATAYDPCRWELENAGELLIYDNLIQLGESFYHQGRYEDTMRCYQAALDHQDVLARKWSIPDALIERIAAGSANFKADQPMRLLGYEWVTLIGHIGFIDCHLRMVEVGVLPRANYVLLAPRDKVVNSAFLALFASKLTVIEDPGLVDELLPYQRLVGDQFIAVRGNGALAEPWAHAAARTQVKSAETQHGPLVTIPQDLLQRGRTRLRAAGVTADWFVALHIREGGYHGDGPGTTRQHRSASVGDYLDAIAQVTSRGGAVVRLGDRSMTPLKSLPGVIDYAHSDLKSAEMDLFLCAQARLFVGTTSGLTTAVQALGTPMLLVNCISNDCQFWHDKTDFTLRLVRNRRTNRYLSLRETYRQPVQSLLIDTALLARRGLEIGANSPQEIADAVAYKLDCLDGKALPLHGDLLSRYERAMRENPCNFGAALPVPGFIENHLELIEDG